MLGVLVITGEYTTGMIRSSFCAVPKRLPVLWGKAMVFATTTFVLDAAGGPDRVLREPGDPLEPPRPDRPPPDRVLRTRACRAPSSAPLWS